MQEDTKLKVDQLVSRLSRLDEKSLMAADAFVKGLDSAYQINLKVKEHYSQRKGLKHDF